MRLFALFGLLVLSPFLSLAQEGGSSDGSSSDPFGVKTHLTISIPVVLESFSVLPVGVQDRHVHPTYNLDIEIEKRPRNVIGFWFGLRNAFTQVSFVPMLGFDLGMWFKAGKALLGIGKSLDFGTTVSNTAFRNSHLDPIRWSFQFRSEFDFPLLRPGIDVKWIPEFSSDLSDREAQSTRVSHLQTWVISPHASISFLNFVMARARLNIYSLGKTAIASKSFGFSVEESTLFQAELAGGLDLGSTELWIVFRSILGSVGDELEHFYHAPYMTNDHLLSARTIRGEVRWEF